MAATSLVVRPRAARLPIAPDGGVRGIRRLSAAVFLSSDGDGGGGLWSRPSSARPPQWSNGAAGLGWEARAVRETEAVACGAVRYV